MAIWRMLCLLPLTHLLRLRLLLQDGRRAPDSVWNGTPVTMMGIASPWAGNVLAVNDDVDFMRLFGNLRVAFGRAAAGYTEWAYRIRLLLCH